MRRLLFKGFCLVLFVSAIGVVVSIPMSAEEVIDPPRPRPSMASFEVPLFVDEGGAVVNDPAPKDFALISSDDTITWGYFAPMFGAVEPKPVKFANPARVDQQMNHNAKVCIAILESIMTQNQVDAFEAALAPSTPEKLGQLREAHGVLRRSGLGPKHQVLFFLDKEIEKTIKAIATTNAVYEDEE